METNFFRFIKNMKIEGDLHIIIANGADDTLVVSTMVNNEKCADTAKNRLAPLNLRGTAQQMDIGYLDTISQPMKEVSGLLSNMEAFTKQKAETQKKSAMANESADKDKKALDAMEQKYVDGMKKAHELEKAGKFREAWMSVPDPANYPDKVEVLRNRREQLSAKFAPDLFADTQNAQIQTEPTDNLYPEHQIEVVDEVEEFGKEEENE